MRVSVIGPIDDDVRIALGGEAEEDREFKQIPGGLVLRFPVEHAAEALTLLKDGLNSFIDLAMARVRRSVSLEDHVPEAVTYIGSVVGRELPQPEPVPESEDSAELDDTSDEDDVGASREPRVRGRAPIFEHGQRSITSLMSDIEGEVRRPRSGNPGRGWGEDTRCTRSLPSADALLPHVKFLPDNRHMIEWRVGVGPGFASF
jgi:hypothetical protein